jgi:hypothetical protein
MKIAIDYDECLSLAPAHWKQFILLFQSLGHEFICVTYRQPDCDPYELNWVSDMCPVIFTGQKAKKPFVEELGHFVDVWIDDTPNTITHDYGLHTGWKWEKICD